MGSNIRDQREVARLTVWERTFSVERIVWTNHPGLSFDVTDVGTGQLLTAESFDDQPGPDEVESLLEQLRDDLENGTLDHTFDDEETRATLAKILVKPCDYIGHTREVDMYCPDCGAYLG